MLRVIRHEAAEALDDIGEVSWTGSENHDVESNCGHSAGPANKGLPYAAIRLRDVANRSNNYTVMTDRDDLCIVENMNQWVAGDERSEPPDRLFRGLGFASTRSHPTSRDVFNKANELKAILLR